MIHIYNQNIYKILIVFVFDTDIYLIEQNNEPDCKI